MFKQICAPGRAGLDLRGESSRENMGDQPLWKCSWKLRRFCSTSTRPEASLYAEKLTRLSEATSGAMKAGLADFFCRRFGLVQHSLGPASAAGWGRSCRRTRDRSPSAFTSGK